MIKGVQWLPYKEQGSKLRMPQSGKENDQQKHAGGLQGSEVHKQAESRAVIHLLF